MTPDEDAFVCHDNGVPARGGAWEALSRCPVCSCGFTPTRDFFFNETLKYFMKYKFFILPPITRHTCSFFVPEGTKEFLDSGSFVHERIVKSESDGLNSCWRIKPEVRCKS